MFLATHFSQQSRCRKSVLIHLPYNSQKKKNQNKQSRMTCCCSCSFISRAWRISLLRIIIFFGPGPKRNFAWPCRWRNRGEHSSALLRSSAAQLGRNLNDAGSRLLSNEGFRLKGSEIYSLLELEDIPTDRRLTIWILTNRLLTNFLYTHKSLFEK